MSSPFKYPPKKRFILSSNDCKLHMCKLELPRKYRLKTENKLIVPFALLFSGAEAWLHSICSVI